MLGRRPTLWHAGAMNKSKEEAFEHGEYRRLIAWSSRLEREAPLLRWVMEQAPGRRLVDLGCGSGEHSAFAAAAGFDAIGVDRSECI